MEFCKIWDFKYLNFLIKSRIHTIKQHKKISILFENHRQLKQKKKEFKNTKKLKKQTVNDGILKKLCFVFKESLFFPIKIEQNFL